MSGSQKAVVSAVVGPDEKVLWTGRPEVEVATSGGRRLRKLITVASLALMLGLAYWLLPESIGLKKLVDAVGTKTLVPVIGSLVVVALFFVFGQDTGSRLNRYFQSLTYAITSRRLLILEGEKVTESYPPERVLVPSVRERSGGRADVVFGQGGSEGRGDVLKRERSHHHPFCGMTPLELNGT